MDIVFEHIDTKRRYYKGIKFKQTTLNDLLKGPVQSNMVDRENKDAHLEELQTLLDETGFATSETLLADIKALHEAKPSDLRSWKIGEAIAEVTLENKFQCRFHWNSLRDVRNPNGNPTGADLLGFIEVDDTVLFLFGEVKTSSEIKNRPPQVMTSKKGIENQLKDLYNSRLKRQHLITSLTSKTKNLDPTDSFKIDYNKALRTYYANPNSYQLVGVLLRDVEPHKDDLAKCYERLQKVILDPIGLKLLALYSPISSNDWKTLIQKATS